MSQKYAILFQVLNRLPYHQCRETPLLYHPLSSPHCAGSVFRIAIAVATL